MKILNILGITYTRKGKQKIAWFNPLMWIVYVVYLATYLLFYQAISDKEEEIL